MELDNYVRGVTSSADIAKLIEARAMAQAEFKPIKKTGHNKFAGFDYSTYGDICEAILPALCKHGFGTPLFQTGVLATGEWVMVGRLAHKTGQWVSCMVPMRDAIDKNGNRREDNQSFESASTYAKKQLILQLAGGWSAGEEEAEQAEEMVSQVNAEAAKAKAPPKPQGPSYYERLKSKMATVVKMPAEIEKLFGNAESLLESGDLSQEEMTRLTKQFGSIRPKKEVAHADA